MRFIVIAYLLIEFYFSLKVWGDIGFFYSVLWIVVSMMLGFRLLALSSFTLAQSMNSLELGKLSFGEFRNLSLAYMMGGLFLIIPGVFTDGLGIIFLLYAFYLQFIAKITPVNPTRNDLNKGNKDENIIDVEIIDERDSSNTLS